MALTAEQIAAMAAELAAWLEKWDLNENVLFYYNGRSGFPPWIYEEPADPGDRTEHVAADHILTVVYEGSPLYGFLYDHSLTIVEHLFEAEEDAVEERLHSYIAKLKLDSELEDRIQQYRFEHPEELADPNEYDEHWEYEVDRDEEDAKLRRRLLYPLLKERERELTQMVLNEWYAIFEKYGVWYEFGESWCLTCFYAGEESVYAYEVKGEDGGA